MVGVMDPTIRNGVVLASEPDANDLSESKYIQVRSLEGRILSDDQVLKLPFTTDDNVHHHEWNLIEFLRLQP